MPEQPEPISVFVISPIGATGTPEARRANVVLDYLIREALPEPKWKVRRADEETDPTSITSKVIERIVNSDIIVADLSGHNPNVFYELAVAHGYKKRVVTIMTDGEKVPFDIVDQRTVFYDLTDPESVHNAKMRLRASAETVMEADDGSINNPLVGYAIFSTASGLADASPNQKIEFAVGNILARLGQIENMIARWPRTSPTLRTSPLFVTGISADAVAGEAAAITRKRVAATDGLDFGAEEE